MNIIRMSLPVIFVVTLITIDLSISIAYAENKNTVKIYKVTDVSSTGKLRLRAWPSTKSRVKVSLPYNAHDLIETGKQRIVGKSRWVEVKWQENTGWVNDRYLMKTGVLLKPNGLTTNKAIASRNNKANNKTNVAVSRNSILNNQTDNTANTARMLPYEYQGDRYDQTIQPTPITVASKTSYSETIKKRNASKWVLNCSGNTPKNWTIKMDVSSKQMFVKLANNKEFNIPITYRKWAPGGQIRMEIGGGKGRNLVDATLEKTFACNNGLSKTNYSYRVNAAVNRGELLSGCCNPVSQ